MSTTITDMEKLLYEGREKEIPALKPCGAIVGGIMIKRALLARQKAIEAGRVDEKRIVAGRWSHLAQTLMNWEDRKVHMAALKTGALAVDFQKDGKYYGAHISSLPTADGDGYQVDITWVCTDEAYSKLEEADRLIPLVADFLVEKPGIEATGAMKEAINSSTTAEMRHEPAQIACDAFYYGYALNHQSIFELSIAMSDDDAIEYAEAKADLDGGELFDIEGNTVEKVEPKAEDLESAEPMTIRAKRTSKKTKAPKVVDFDMATAQAGGYVLDYEWPKEAREHIPSLSTLEDYVPTKEFKQVFVIFYNLLNAALARMGEGLEEGLKVIGMALNILLLGRPGTGKTRMINALAACFGLPVWVSAQSKNTDEDEFEGKTKIVDGKTEFVGSAFVYGAAMGGIILLEEVNLSPAGVVMGACGQFMEAPYILKMNGYEDVHRHPLCIVAGAMNVGTEGSRLLNEALSSRFKFKVTLADPTEADFMEILSKDGNSKEECAYALKAYNKVLGYMEKKDLLDLAGNITLRGCTATLACMRMGIPAKEALRIGIVNNIAERDMEVAEEVYKSCIDSLPDL